MEPIKVLNKAAVLGAGVMGSGIAALLAGVGVEVLLLDIVPGDANPKDRSCLARKAKEKVQNPKSRILFTKEHAARIAVGNIEDDLEKVADCDWIVEAVTERLEVKTDLFLRVIKHCKPGAILSTNTSGVSVNAIAKALPEQNRKHFMGTHFFNPVRYMRLLELIPAEDTLANVMDYMAKFGEQVFGKGVVIAKDTPNFIGNRIGSYSSLSVLRLTQTYGYSVDKVDQLTGPVIGRPKTATFRTLDMVGLDIFSAVAGNVVNQVDDAQERKRFAMPEIAGQLINSGALGDKTGSGFYQKNPDRTISRWNWQEQKYEVYKISVPDAVTKALASAGKYAAMVYGEAEENRFCWELVKDILLYSAAKVPEITEDYRTIDRVMEWGYNWEKGPFAIWDEIGLARSVLKMKEEGEQIPAWVEEKIANGETAFYQAEEARSPYLVLDHKSQPVVRENADATLLDIGDGVLCLEFHSKGNALLDGTMDLLKESVEMLHTNDWKGLVLGNHGKNFCAGANLGMIAELTEQENWSKISRLQYILMDVKYAPRPVVAAPFRMTLGGGAEVAMHCAGVSALEETYIGLVELGVGLVPSGGGCKESVIRAIKRCGSDTKQAMLPAIKEAWRRIATAQVSSSAHDAIAQGTLDGRTRVVMNPDMLIEDAKAYVLELAGRYHPPVRQGIPVLGDFGRAAMENELEAMLGGGFVSEYDAYLAGKVAYILTGGDVPAGTLVPEEYLLELEHQTFVGLCKQEKTQQRVAHMIATGKPLRN